MIHLATKPDAAEALERMERWWTCDNEDRAVLQLWVDGPPVPRVKEWATPRDFYFDVEGRVDQMSREVEMRTYFAETFPSFEPNLGPDVVSALFGVDIEFAWDTTWATAFIEDPADILSIVPNPDHEVWQTIEALQRRGIEEGRGRWITLYTDLHPNIDVLSALMGPQEACLAVADDPELVQRIVEHVTPTCVDAYRRQIAPLLAEGLPVGTWMRIFHQGPSYVPQCDFSAMVSPAFFREAILPSIRVEMAAAERNIYHLDGPDALRHLDALLQVPEIDAIQWVYGAGKGPARNWLPVYRRILDAGKAIRVEAQDVEDIRVVQAEFGGRGVLYACGFTVPSREEAETILRILD